MKGVAAFATELAFRGIFRATNWAVHSNTASTLSAKLGFGDNGFFAIGTTHGGTIYRVEAVNSIQGRHAQQA
jgi:hypothetical protein